MYPVSTRPSGLNLTPPVRPLLVPRTTTETRREPHFRSGGRPLSLLKIHICLYAEPRTCLDSDSQDWSNLWGKEVKWTWLSPSTPWKATLGIITVGHTVQDVWLRTSAYRCNRWKYRVPSKIRIQEKWIIQNLVQFYHTIDDLYVYGQLLNSWN